MTRRLHTVIIVFIQNALIIWFSKKQNTIYEAMFGSEFVALRICKYFIYVLGYKLQMFVFRLKVPEYIFGDNWGVMKNMSILESVLCNKHNAINHHSYFEAVAADILKIGK